MNHLVQRAKLRGQTIKVPSGLPELLSDITREVLRCQPTEECLIQFVMDYLHSVLETREKASVVKAVIDRSLQVVDEIISDLCICNIDPEKAEELALVMEECFRKFLQKRRCERGIDKEMLKFGEDDILDELIRRCKFSVEELQKSMPFIENAYQRFVDAYMNASDKAGGSEALYLYFKQREERRSMENQRNLAAITIQKNWRGFLVRRVLDIRKRMKKCDEWRREQEEAREKAILDHAASIIQRFFKRIMQKCSLRQLSKEDIGEEEELYEFKSQLSLDPFSRPERGITAKSEEKYEAEKSESSEKIVETADQESMVFEETVEPPQAELFEEGSATETVEVEPQVQPEGRPETETEATMEEPEPTAEPEVQTLPAVELEPEPEPEPSADPQPEVELQPEPEPEPSPDDPPEVELQPEPEPEPDPEPEPRSEQIEAPIEDTLEVPEEEPANLESAEVVTDAVDEDGAVD